MDQEPAPAAPEAEPGWSTKVRLIHERLETAGVPHAFGGAIAVNYHRDPRSTTDIDINIFLPTPAPRTRPSNLCARCTSMKTRTGCARN